MPILTIKALPQKDPKRIGPALKATCAAIARAADCDERHVWATWEEIKPGLYAEGQQTPDLQPSETHPPICQLLCFEGFTQAEIEKVLLATSKTLSEELGIPGNVFVTYHEAKSGQVIAGDGIVRK